VRLHAAASWPKLSQSCLSCNDAGKNFTGTISRSRFMINAETLPVMILKWCDNVRVDLNVRGELAIRNNNFRQSFSLLLHGRTFNNKKIIFIYLINCKYRKFLVIYVELKTHSQYDEHLL
jgi:hypothetical protein